MKSGSEIKLVKIEREQGRDYPKNHSFGCEDPEGFEQMVSLYIERIKNEEENKRALASM